MPYSCLIEVSAMLGRWSGWLTFGQVFGQGLHVVGSVLPGSVCTQVSTHGLHLLLQGHLGVLLCPLGKRNQGKRGEQKSVKCFWASLVPYETQGRFHRCHCCYVP